MIYFLLYTVQELCHHKLCSFVMAIYFIVFFLIYFFTQFAVSGHLKIAIDFGLFICFVTSITFPILYTIPFIYRHQEQALWPFFLTKNISRTQLLIYTLLSFTIIFLTLCLLNYGIALCIIKFFTSTWVLYIWPAYISIAMQGIFFISTAFFFSLITQPSIAQLALITIYFVCYTNHEWVHILQQNEQPLTACIATLLYYCLPDLSLLDMQSEVIYQLPLSFCKITLSFIYISLFCLFFILSSLRVFNTKKL